MPKTTFTAAKNGFQFPNKFKPQIYAGPIDISLNGLCGGMSYAALDFFFAGRPIPAETSLPEDGSVLEEYIYDRHLTALGDTIWKWAERLFNPFGWRTSEFFHWGLQAAGGGELEWLRKSIDAGRPCVLGLVSPGGLFENHFVVATGYEWSKREVGPLEFDDLKIQIYDNRDPDKEMVLTANLDELRYVENNGDKWITYFVDRNYRPKVPHLGRSPCTDHHIRQLSGQDLSGRDFIKADFRCARCIRTKFVGCTASDSDFSNALLTGADFYGATLQDSDLAGVSADDAIFYGANCRSASFAGASVMRGDFYGADLHNARLASATIDHGEFYGAHMASSDLSSGKFYAANFYGADLSHTVCEGAVFIGANFYGADLSHSDLKDTSCAGANFLGADLSYAKLNGGNYVGANFQGANLGYADLSHGNFTDADFAGANLANTTRTGAIGLP
jgi:uncharacterized protein YjbI with pentapeptide repeats